MIVEITGVSEEWINDTFADPHAESPLFYDEDYTILYGAGWKIVGVRLMTERAVVVFTENFAPLDIEPEDPASAAERIEQEGNDRESRSQEAM